MVPEDSCSDGIRLCVYKNNREIPECSFFPISNLHPRGFAVSSIFPWDLSVSIIAFSGSGSVSVPEPGLSPDILYRCSCIRSGGETFLRPEGPSAVQPLSHFTCWSHRYISLIIYIFGKPHRLKAEMISLQYRYNTFSNILTTLLFLICNYRR